MNDRPRYSDVPGLSPAKQVAIITEHWSDDPAAACVAADIAVAEDDQELIDRASKLLDSPRFGGEYSVVGRRYAFAALRRDAATVRQISRPIPVSKVQNPFWNGLLRMIDTNRPLEERLWSTLAGWYSSEVLTRQHAVTVAVPLVHASRLLGIARTRANNDVAKWSSASRAVFATYWGAYPRTIVPSVRGALWAYGDPQRGPHRVIPFLLPYQVASICETLTHIQALPPKLARDAARTMHDEMLDVSLERRARFAELARFSPTARRSL